MNLQSFERFKLTHTYIYYDGPLAFSCLINNDEFFAYSWDVGTKGMEYLFIPVNSVILSDLLDSRISIHDFIERESKKHPIYSCWFNDGKASDMRTLTWAELEKECLLEKDVFLFD